MTKVIIEEIFPRPDLIDLPPPVAGANDVRSLRLLVVVCSLCRHLLFVHV